MSSLTTVAAATVATRRVLAKRPWIHWFVVLVAALGATLAVMDHTTGVDAAKESWGRTRTVWVATADLAPGDPMLVESRDVPAAMVEGDAIGEGDLDDAVVKQRIGRGEIVHRSDIAVASGPRAMTPDGWLVVAVLESPPSGAAVGDRAVVVADGVTIGEDALVVGHHDAATLVAMPAQDAQHVPAAADAGGVALLILP